MGHVDESTWSLVYVMADLSSGEAGQDGGAGCKGKEKDKNRLES